jgi:hypothetical protein
MLGFGSLFWFCWSGCCSSFESCLCFVLVLVFGFASALGYCFWPSSWYLGFGLNVGLGAGGGERRRGGHLRQQKHLLLLLFLSLTLFFLSLQGPMSLSTPMEAPSAFAHGVYDLTKQFTPYMDQHLLLPLLEWLENTERYAHQDVLKAQLNVLKSTKMIDRRIQIQAQLNERNGVCVVC